MTPEPQAFTPQEMREMAEMLPNIVTDVVDLK